MEIAVPEPVIAWLRDHGLGERLLHLHIARLWTQLSESQQAFLTQSGLNGLRPLWVEMASSGLFYLAMARVLRRQLLIAFPEEADTFDGWSWPPLGNRDDDGLLPGLGSTTPLPLMVRHLLNELKEDDISSLSSAEFGDLVACPNRGLTSFLMARMSEPKSPIDLGDPLQAVENLRFWRLHGWLDDLWSGFQNLHGLSDSDPTEQWALRCAESFLREPAPPIAPEALDAVRSLIRTHLRLEVSVALTLPEPTPGAYFEIPNLARGPKYFFLWY